MDVEDLVDAAVLTRKQVSKGLESLLRVGLIDRDANTCSLFVVRWNERQFESDDVSLRTAKHRSKERSSNGVVTDQIQKTDTETEIYPLTPAERGNPRSLGTNPRAIAGADQKRRADAINNSKVEIIDGEPHRLVAGQWVPA